jgi:uncharacterized protein
MAGEHTTRRGEGWRGPAGQDLESLLGALDPYRRPGEFVFCRRPQVPTNTELVAAVHEDEGFTVVVPRDIADEAGWAYDFIAAMITLRVRSRLNAVGLTAAVSSLLANAGISCNVVAGYFHDHLFVPVEKAEEALDLLSHLSSGGSSFGPT